MSDYEMTAFERRLAGRLQGYAAIPVRPVDARATASAAAVARRRSGWPSLVLPRLAPAYLLLLMALLAIAAAAAFAAALLRNQDPTVPTGRNGLIAYSVSDIPTRPYNHVHVMNPDGTGDREISQGTAPRYSVDGETLAFFTGWGGFEIGTSSTDPRLWLADGDGTNLRDVAPYQQTGFELSPDGLRLAVRGSGSEPGPLDRNGIWLVDVADGSSRELVPRPADGLTGYGSMTWSPDGRYIAYAVMRDVRNGDNSGTYRVGIDLVDVETGEAKRLTSRPGTDSALIAWAPDSRRLAFSGVPDGSPLPSPGNWPSDAFFLPEDIFVVRVDGSDEHNITNSTDFDGGPLLWSPDGSALVYRPFAGYRESLAIVEVEGTQAHGDPRLGPSADNYVWSPDGTMLLQALNVEIEPSTSGDQQFQGTIQTIDPSFEQPPTTIARRNSLIGWLSWQWLEP